MYRIVAGEMSTQRRQSRRLASAEPEEALPPPVPKHVEAEINVTEAKASQDMPRSTRCAMPFDVRLDCFHSLW